MGFEFDHGLYNLVFIITTGMALDNLCYLFLSFFHLLTKYDTPTSEGFSEVYMKSCI